MIYSFHSTKSLFLLYSSRLSSTVFLFEFETYSKYSFNFLVKFPNPSLSISLYSSEFSGLAKIYPMKIFFVSLRISFQSYLEFSRLLFHSVRFLLEPGNNM